MKKRIIASFIAIALMLSQVSAFAMHEPIHGENEETERYMRLYTDTENEFEDNDNAELFDLTSGDYKYTVNSDGTVEITYYNGTDTEITIPSEIDGKKVTSIGDNVFYGCSSLTSVTIPDSVTSIGDISFSGCSRLESIELPDSVTSIGRRAFYECRNLASITIPDSVTSIGSSAFDDCDNLTIYGYKNSYAQEYANDNNIPFSLILEFNDVTLDKPEGSYDNGKVNVKVTINTEKDSGFKVYAAVYDDNGNMIGIKEVSVSDKSVTVDAKEKPKKVKVFAFKTADGASPLCENQEITDIK